MFLQCNEHKFLLITLVIYAENFISIKNCQTLTSGAIYTHKTSPVMDGVDLFPLK